MFDLLIDFYRGFFGFFGSHGRGGTFLVYMVVVTMLIGMTGALVYRLLFLLRLIPHENEFDWVADAPPSDDDKSGAQTGD